MLSSLIDLHCEKIIVAIRCASSATFGMHRRCRPEKTNAAFPTDSQCFSVVPEAGLPIEPITIDHLSA